MALPARDDQNKPLWFELALATSAVALFFGLERFLYPPDQRAPSKNSAHHDEQDEPLSGGEPVREAIGQASFKQPPTLQQSRAAQRGRGRYASVPTSIPLNGWKDILWRVYNQIQNDRLLAVAAGAVFYMLLALFPALTALVSLFGLFTDASLINEHLSLLGGVMPAGAITIIREQVTRLSNTGSDALSLGFMFGMGLAMWSANAGMKAIIDALNVVYDEREKRGFLRLTLVAFAFTIGGLIFIILALAAVVVLPLVLGWLGLSLTPPN